MSDHGFWYGIGVVFFVLVAGVGGKACRDAAVDACEGRGGRAITSPWYSENYTEVRCIEP